MTEHAYAPGHCVISVWVPGLLIDSGHRSCLGGRPVLAGRPSRGWAGVDIWKHSCLLCCVEALRFIHTHTLWLAFPGLPACLPLCRPVILANVWLHAAVFLCPRLSQNNLSSGRLALCLSGCVPLSCSVSLKMSHLQTPRTNATRWAHIFPILWRHTASMAI